ncbi:hypothetical protein EUTSA_v10006306mg [Eutrema salsugineum]|uniref:Uncharacterized protein n=1 Tax=Eutrema salsugineum TaxID=72664 RepID=V4LP61_EUTSA|nr:uncharacterized protein LOC18019803 [Eutrema salsugineum]ESQ44277.1 hypothetical protein EUTSA_v10006306mg [Eutrema salsugineum]
MRRGRGKGKRQNATAREDRGSGEEEKIPAYRRRGRPQKPVKDETEGEDEILEKEEEKDDDTNGSVVTSKEEVTENGRKRKKPVESKESNITEEENGLGSKLSTDDSVKSSSIGFRQNGSRRKNKPRRAAEAVVECNGI